MYLFGVPVIAFCDDHGDEQTSSDGEPDAGIGAQVSIEARPQGEGASNIPSSTPNRLPNLNEPAPPLTDEELAAESEANAAECDRLLAEICQQAEEIARNAGISEEERLSSIKDASSILLMSTHWTKRPESPSSRTLRKRSRTWKPGSRSIKNVGDGGARTLLMTRNSCCWQAAWEGGRAKITQVGERGDRLVKGSDRKDRNRGVG